MFSWLSNRKDVPDDAPPTPDLAQLQAQDLAVVFKHSPSCPTSWAAQKQVEAFAANNPAVPVYTILVRQDREISQQIAAFTKIRHQSPQVIVLRHGVPVADASHQDVTLDFLTDAIAASPHPA